MAVSDTSKLKVAASGLIPFAFVIVLMLYIFGPGGDMLDFGIALPEITIEQVDFIDSEIQATVRNTGPIPVQVVVADVNDRIQPAAVEPDGYLERYETTLVRIPFEWNEAEPYRIGITIDDGTRFEKEIESAAPALKFTPAKVIKLVKCMMVQRQWIGWNKNKKEELRLHPPPQHAFGRNIELI